MTDKEKLNYEKEVLGLFISGHPLEKYKDEIAELPCTSISNLGEESGNGEAAIVGIITNLKVKTSKSGKLFGIANIEDTGGIIEALFFPNVYQQYGELI
jgi:DNA polymerase-3 subunit alpha